MKTEKVKPFEQDDIYEIDTWWGPLSETWHTTVRFENGDYFCSCDYITDEDWAKENNKTP